MIVYEKDNAIELNEKYSKSIIRKQWMWRRTANVSVGSYFGSTTHGSDWHEFNIDIDDGSIHTAIHVDRIYIRILEKNTIENMQCFPLVLFSQKMRN